MDTIHKISKSYVDMTSRPYQDIRIKHTHVLDDPYPDDNFSNLFPPLSPSNITPSAETVEARIPYETDVLREASDELLAVDREEKLQEREATSRANVLTMLGDIPDPDFIPPENVLFVCKLNPVTSEEDLLIIFSRFGKVKRADIIKDHKTGDPLNFGFIEFALQTSCEEAYTKMNNVLIDERRIKVDYCQSVSNTW